MCRAELKSYPGCDNISGIPAGRGSQQCLSPLRHLRPKLIVVQLWFSQLHTPPRTTTVGRIRFIVNLILCLNARALSICALGHVDYVHRDLNLAVAHDYDRFLLREVYGRNGGVDLALLAGFFFKWRLFIPYVEDFVSAQAQILKENLVIRSLDCICQDVD